jgi:hypothetical protein
MCSHCFECLNGVPVRPALILSISAMLLAYVKKPHLPHLSNTIYVTIEMGKYFFNIWHGVCSVIKKHLYSLRDTAMRLRSQRPLHVQGDASHPG